MIALGVHIAWNHDSGAAVISNNRGSLEIYSIGQERLDRKKYSAAFPEQSIFKCLSAAGVMLRDVNVIVLDIYHGTDYGQKMGWDEFVDKYKIHHIPVMGIDHHESHAYASFYSSGFKRAAVLIVDAEGTDNRTQTLFAAERGEEIVPVSTAKGVSIGMLYGLVTRKIGFKHLEDGKTMGLAPYGSDKYLIGSYGTRRGLSVDYSIMANHEKGLLFNQPVDNQPGRTQAHNEGWAKWVQNECEEVMVYLANYAADMMHEDYLCLSGGVALNSVANYKVLRHSPFKDVYINPAASDTGIPLGNALKGWESLGQEMPEAIGPYLGFEYGPQEVAIAATYATEQGAKRIEDHQTKHYIADLLADNKVIGWFTGRSETGPRALGARSILMSPLRGENKNWLNEKVKHREAFRPYAPVVMEEYCQSYFDIDRPSPYMLMVPKVKVGAIPAVTHVDQTARLQTVNSNQNRRLYTLLKYFTERRDVPVLLNTSFNVAGEPIVETPMDAVKCFLQTGIDALYLEGWVLEK